MVQSLSASLKQLLTVSLNYREMELLRLLRLLAVWLLQSWARAGLLAPCVIPLKKITLSTCAAECETFNLEPSCR